MNKMNESPIDKAARFQAQHRQAQHPQAQHPQFSRPQPSHLNIGAAAKACGLPTKTVRYYADVGLVVPTVRADNGYRLYAAPELERLRFVARARSFGFSVDTCRELLSLYEDGGRSSRDVKEVALRHLGEIEEKMQALGKLHAELSGLAESCRGDNQSDCPILTSFAYNTENSDAKTDKAEQNKNTTGATSKKKAH